MYFCGANFNKCQNAMLVGIKRTLKEVKATANNQNVWEVSTIEYIGGKRNADSALFETFVEANKFYNILTSTFEKHNLKFEIIKNTSKEENDKVVFKNIVYKILEPDKYITVGVCLKRKNTFSLNQIIGND